MTLTEEQRGALARAIDYIDKTDLPVGKLDGFDREVLRNMATAAINHDPDVMKMIELLAAGEHDQWSAWAQSILDSEPGLSEGRKAAWPGMIATPYENLSEELKDKDRREVHLRSGVALDHIQQQSIEIERLRGYEIAARDLSADLTKVAGDRDEHAARIKELEDAHKRSGKKYAKIINELRSSVYANIPGLDVGKIGPDAAKPRSWQITEERVGLLEYCLETLLDAPDIEEIPGPGHSIEMLRAMLREAGL
jgi:hypothetical protein